MAGPIAGDMPRSKIATVLRVTRGNVLEMFDFFMRGAYVDRIGRRQGLITTLMIMACGTIRIAFVPGYATIGLLAPILVPIGRLVQGFSAGVELGGVSVYLAEMATPGHKRPFARLPRHSSVRPGTPSSSAGGRRWARPGTPCAAAGMA